MKTNKIILAVLSMFFCNVLNSQTIVWDQEQKADFRHTPFRIVRADKESFFVQGYRQQRSGPTFTITKHQNDGFSKIFEKDISAPIVNNNQLDLVDLAYLDNQFILFSKFYDKQKKSTFTYAHKVSDDGVLDLDYVELGEVSAKSNRERGFFDIEFSEDKNYFMLIEVPHFDKYADEKFSYKVYDKNLKLIWHQQIVLPFKNSNFSISNYFVDNNANVYMAAKIYYDKSKGEVKERGMPDYRRVILVYNHKLNSLTEYEIKIDNQKFPTDIAYFLHNDQLKVFGFYSELNKEYGSVGFFNISINLDSGKIVDSNFEPFSNDFFAKFVGESKAHKKETLSTGYIIKDLILDESGGYLFLAEYYSSYISCTTSNGRTSCTNHYKHNDIVAVSVDSKGLLNWIQRVPKKQHTLGDYLYASYIMGYSNGNIHLIFNDNPSNIKAFNKSQYPTKLVSMMKAQKSVSVIVTLDIKDGSMNRNVLLNNKESKTILRPSFHKQISKDEILIYAVRGSRYKFGKITF